MHAAQARDVSPAAQLGGGGTVVSAPCEVWGVLNVTPDSFSDGGQHVGDRAVEHALAMLHQGAAVIDVGGESTRPPGKTYGAGAQPVSTEEELRRVVPVVERLVAEGARVSVDTTKAEVARAALQAGAGIINDVSMGASDGLLEVVADSAAELVLMHNRGRGEREGDNARYDDVVSDALAEVQRALSHAVEVGVARERIWLDPGLGFAKTAEDSGRLLAQIDAWTAVGQRVLVGASRKSFLAVMAQTPDAGPGDRLAASVVAACAAQAAGCAAVRVHDVAATAQALRLATALGRESRR